MRVIVGERFQRFRWRKMRRQDAVQIYIVDHCGVRGNVCHRVYNLVTYLCSDRWAWARARARARARAPAAATETAAAAPDTLESPSRSNTANSGSHCSTKLAFTPTLCRTAFAAECGRHVVIVAADQVSLIRPTSGLARAPRVRSRSQQIVERQSALLRSTISFRSENRLRCTSSRTSCLRKLAKMEDARTHWQARTLA